MKNLKDILNEAYLFEDFFKNVGSTPEDNKRRKTISLIKDWLKKYKIKNYIINKDLTIDVNEDVRLSRYPEKEFPDYIQFNHVHGDFDISDSKLTTLRGCPKILDQSFFCCFCDNLIDLTGTIEKVGKCFNCEECKNLKSLEGCPIILGNIICGYCVSLDYSEIFDITNKQVRGDVYTI